jgi:hypothetical protein
MAEDTIKLFAKRSERFPQRDDSGQAGEFALEALKKVPLVGDVTAYITSLFFDPFEERRNEWFKELADAFEELESDVEGMKAGKLFESPAFVTAAIQATRIAVGTHQAEKRAYLRNALLSIAKGLTTDETKQHMFLNAVDAFTPAHVKALNLLWRGAVAGINWDLNSIPMGQRNYGAAIGILAPEVKGQPSFISAILADLRNRGFSMLGSADLSFPQGGVITNLGIEFLSFVMSPERK